MAFLDIDNLSVHFPITKGIFKKTVGRFKAVENVSFGLKKGETVSIIGESGSGKTTIGNVILGLTAPTIGEIRYDGKPLADVRFSGTIQAVFQNPYSSLDPRMNVLDVVTEPLRYSKNKPGKNELSRKAKESLEEVSIDGSSVYLYPHEFSGGQRQRISIARALISSPQLIVLDEPVSSLDVSVRAQILNLLAELKKKRNLSYIYISHDLATVRFLSENVVILYNGRIMESGSTDAIFDSPKHPYTELLLRSAKDILVKSAADDVGKSVSGCSFYGRCPKGDENCGKAIPGRTEIGEGHYVYCYKV